MNKYLKQVARYILKDEIDAELIKLKESRDLNEALSSDKKKLEKKIKQMEDPEAILLKFYRIDNVSKDGMPPSYLDPNKPNEYVQRVTEIDSVFQNRSFREMVAWALNFHANMSVTGKIKNQFGDEIDISSQEANAMIKGIRSIWDLVVGAHNKNQQISKDKNFDKYALMEVEEEDIE